MSTSYASAAFSWGFMLFLGGTATYIYNPDLITRLLPASQPKQQQAPAPTAPKASTKKSKKPQTVKETVTQATNTVTSGAEEASRTSKKRKVSAPVNKTVTATAAVGQKKELPRDADNDIDDKDFAKQLAKAQAGTNLQSKSQQKGAGSAHLAATLQSSNPERPSAAGSSSDNDLSQAESSQQRPTSGKDISDMLEAPAAAPSTLRLTNVQEAKKPKQTSKQSEQSISKKKRNEQARREEQRQLNQESERLHEQKKQEHLRRARMAEGTSNQTKANQFAASVGNAWQNKAPTNSTAQSATSAPLLDTFDPVTSSKDSVQTQQTSGNNVAKAEPRTNGNAVGHMSEEEQIKIVREKEHEDAWEPVTSKKLMKKKTRKDNDTSSEASSVPPAPVPAPAPAPVQPTSSRSQTNVANSNSAPKVRESNNRFASIQSNNLKEDDWAA